MTSPGGFCGVCRQAFQIDPPLLCPKCRTPYHPECWRYNDRRCAVYACTPLRGAMRVIRGRGLSRGDTVVMFMGGAMILFLFLYLRLFF